MIRQKEVYSIEPLMHTYVYHTCDGSVKTSPITILSRGSNNRFVYIAINKIDIEKGLFLNVHIKIYRVRQKERRRYKNPLHTILEHQLIVPYNTDKLLHVWLNFILLFLDLYNIYTRIKHSI